MRTSNSPFYIAFRNAGVKERMTFKSNEKQYSYKSVGGQKMKREDLKKQLVEAGVAEDKINGLVDYVMSQNGTDLNTLKSELEQVKSSHAQEVETLKAQNSELSSKVEGYKDYEDLKKFKADTMANQEKSKRIDFLKAQGCKHPDLIMTQLDFEKASYDEEKKTYVGLDDSLKTLKTNYADLFEKSGTQQIPTNTTPNKTGSDFYEEYKRNNPDVKGL